MSGDPGGPWFPRATGPVPTDIRNRGRILGAGMATPDNPFAPGADASEGPTQRTLLAFPPDIYPIPGAVQFRKRATFNSPAAGTIEPAALVFPLPSDQIGVLKIFGFGLLNMLATTDVGWSLWFDNNVVPGYEDLGFFPGPVPRVTEDDTDLLIPIPMGARISVKFRNGDGAAYVAGANYFGWSYTPESADRWAGSAGRSE